MSHLYAHPLLSGGWSRRGFAAHFSGFQRSRRCRGCHLAERGTHGRRRRAARTSEGSDMRVVGAALFLAMLLFVSHLHGTVYAYLDPGRGSIAIQLLLGVFVAVLAAVRLYWERMKTFLRR